MASLHVVRGACGDSLFQLGSRLETLIGRDPSCDVVFSERTISRHHARITRQNGDYFIEDLESVNGVVLNGRRIATRVKLADGDHIALHDVVLRFYVAEPQETDSATTDLAENLRAERSLEGAPEDKEQDAGDGGQTRDEQSTIVTQLNALSTFAERSPENAVEILDAILEITHSLGTSLNLGEVLPRTLDSLFRIFPQAKRGYILQREKISGNLELRAIRHESSGSDTVSPIGGHVAQRVMREGSAFISGNTATDDRISELAATVLDESEPIRSVMCAPLMGPSQSPLGVIHLETNDPKYPFRQSDLQVLVSVALLAGQAVEYTEIHEELLELDRHNVELELARDLQLTFLPQRAPRTASYQFAHHYRAAQYVAGDFFEYVELPNGRLAVTVGDVAGHGISAALTMARLCSEIRYALLTTETPAEAVSKLNWQLAVQMPDLPFITQVLCVLNDHDNTLTVVNAGHPYPLLRRAGSSEIVQLDEIAGLPLGVHDTTSYNQFVVTLRPGDLVLLYTDGVSDAMNRSGELYKTSRLAQAALKAGPEPKHVIRAVLNDVRNFSEGRPFHDDVCLLSLARRRDA